MNKNESRVAIIGAGISGLILARTLHERGVGVKVFEKSRGVGGRMATRRTSEGLRFDHGAQYFTVRDERFKSFVDSCVIGGVAGRWDGRICALANGNINWKQESNERFVGKPGMNELCRQLAGGLEVELNTELQPPEFRSGLWHIADKQGQNFGKFDYFVTSAPSPQSALLLEAAPELRAVAESTKMNPCWAIMLGLNEPLDLPFDGAFVDDSPLSWIARNDSKPSRTSSTECWVLHASSEWTAKHLESDPDDVGCQLVDAFWTATGATPQSTSYVASHRWRYALPPEPFEQTSLFDAQLRVGACGDWCGGPRVEGAFLSGLSLADRVLAHLSDR